MDLRPRPCSAAPWVWALCRKKASCSVEHRLRLLRHPLFEGHEAGEASCRDVLRAGAVRQERGRTVRMVCRARRSRAFEAVRNRRGKTAGYAVHGQIRAVQLQPGREVGAASRHRAIPSRPERCERGGRICRCAGQRSGQADGCAKSQALVHQSLPAACFVGQPFHDYRGLPDLSAPANIGGCHRCERRRDFHQSGGRAGRGRMQVRDGA